MASERIATTDGDELTEDDLGIVYEELIDISRKWFVLGLALGGLPVSTLENIKEQQAASFDKCLLDLLKAWLKQIRKPRTWAAVVEALRRKSVNEHKVADAIESKYFLIRRSRSAPADVSNAAQNLTGEVPQVQSCGVEDVVQLQHTPKDDCKAVASTSTQVTSSTLPSRPREDLHEQADTQVDSGEEPLYKYLNVKGLTEDERHALFGRLTIQYKRISGSYAKLNQDIRSSLTSRNITPSQVANVLMEISAFPLRGKDSAKPLLEDCLESIEAARSIQAVFKILRPYGSFFDCHIVKHIVNSHLCTDDDKSNLKRYLSQLDNYCRRNIYECPHIASCDSRFPKLLLKVDDIVSQTFTMKSLDAFSAEVAETLNLSRHTLRVCSAEEGCLRLTYQISQFVVDKVFPLSPSQEKRLKSLGISRLMCGPTWMYNLSASEAQEQKVSRADSVLMTENNIGCIRYKLLGECPFGDHCRFGHLTEPIAIPSFGTVPAPTDKSIIGRAFQSSGGKGYIILEVKGDPKKVRIVAEDDLTLRFAKRVTLMSTSSSASRFKYIYVHSELLKNPDLLLSFKVHDEADSTAKTNYQIIKVQPSSVCVSSTQKVDPPTIEGCSSALNVKTGSLLDNLEFRQTPQVYSTMVVSEHYRKEIHDRLREALVWMKKKGFSHPKLEGRLGKIFWRKQLKGDRLEAEKCIKFLVQQEGVKKSSFTSKIDGESVEALRKINVQNLHSKTDEYLFSLQPKNEREGQHFACVAFTHGRPEILYVTRHNKKDWVVINFDILSLHRKYDVRLSLRCIEKVSTTDPSLQRFITSSLSMSESGVIHYNPKASKEEWSLNYIRHQKWECYNFRDSKYMLEIFDMGEFIIEETDFCEHHIAAKDFKTNQEVELHCKLWDRYSNKYIHSTFDSPLPPHSWTPEQIMEDFEKDGFLKMLDELNQTLELVSTSV